MNYEKPIANVTDDIIEGVYLASGCYTTTAYIHQKPETSRGDYRIHVDGKHHANHTREKQQLHISFNQSVEFISGGKLISGNNTANLVIEYNYHQNPEDNIGFGDLVVKSTSGLAIVDVSFTD